MNVSDTIAMVFGSDNPQHHSQILQCIKNISRGFVEPGTIDLILYSSWLKPTGAMTFSECF